MYNLSKKRAKIAWKKRLFASTSIFLMVGVFLLPHYAWASVINDENIIKLTNQARLEEGLKELTANQLLSKAAYDKAEAIFETQEFKHDIDEKKFSVWVKNAGYEYQNVGENLAIDFISSEGTMSAWLDSPSHKKNILNPRFQEIGVAIKQDKFEGQESIVVVQIFGTPIANNTTAILESEDEINNSEVINNSEQSLNSAKTVFITNTNPENISFLSKYLPEIPNLYGQDISLEYITQIALIVLDYTDILLMNYYYSVILLLLFVFSAAYVWQRKEQSHLLER